MLNNYKYCNPCCWCANYVDIDSGKSYCMEQQEKVGSLYTCDKWEEIFEEENNGINKNN